jgi:hypothetical protein
MCSAAITRQTDDYSAVILGIGTSGDVDVSLPGDHPLNVICGAVGVSVYGVPQPVTDLNSSPLNVLNATAAIAGTLTAGTTAHYTVTLQNTTGQPVPLTPCPSYSSRRHRVPGRHSVSLRSAATKAPSTDDSSSA